MIHRKGGPSARPSLVRALGLGPVAALLLGLSGALAHEGAPRVLVSPDRVSPGGVVDIRGEDLGQDADLRLLLVGGAGEVELARTSADGEGHVVASLVVPTDLPNGTYRLRAEPQANGIAAPLDAILIVEGAPIGAGGEPGPKDEDDLLLIALPSDWQRSLSGPIVTAVPLTETLPAGSATRPSVDAVTIAVVTGLALAAIALIVASRLRRPGSPA